MNDETTAANDQTATTNDAASASTTAAPPAAADAGTAASNPPAGGILGGIENKLEAIAGEVKEFFGAHPTPAEARAMFIENRGLDSVVTTEGRLFRNGTIETIPAA